MFHLHLGAKRPQNWPDWSLFLVLPIYPMRGHTFMTSTRRGGVRLRWTHADKGRGSAPCGLWTSTQKIRAHWELVL